MAQIEEGTQERYARIGRESEKEMVADALHKISQGLPQRMLNEESYGGKPGALSVNSNEGKMDVNSNEMARSMAKEMEPLSQINPMESAGSKMPSMQEALDGLAKGAGKAMENVATAVKESIKSSSSHEFEM